MTAARFLRRLRAAAFVRAACVGGVRAAAGLGVWFLLTATLDGWFHLPLLIRQGLWVVAVSAAGGLFLFAFRPFQQFGAAELSRRVAAAAAGSSGRRWRSDDLRIADAFSRGDEGGGETSAELRSAFVDEISGHLAKVRFAGVLPPWRWRSEGAPTALALLIGLFLWAAHPAAFAALPRVVAPFGERFLERVLTIHPGDADVGHGETVVVTVTERERLPDRPALFVRHGDTWVSVPPAEEAAGTQTFLLENVVDPLIYRVRLKREWSRRFFITPVAPIDITAIEVTVHPPAYLRGEPVVSASPEVAGLPGSAVRLQARLSHDVLTAVMVFSDGTQTRVSVDRARRLLAEFAMHRGGTYAFRFEGRDGMTGRAGPFPIHVLTDEPPTITLISPQEDLIVGERERLPITFEATDDYGLGAVRLHWEGGGVSRQNEIIRFGEPIPHVLRTHTWNLERERFSPGAVVRFRLEAVDVNTITGPGRAFSPWRTIEIAGFERTHAQIEEALETWREEAVATLAQVNLQQARVRDGAMPTEEMPQHVGDTARRTRALEEAMKQIARMMENDPLTDFGVLLEHQALADNLTHLNETAVRSAQAAAMTGHEEALAGSLGAVSSELGRMIALSEELSRRQRATDVLHAGERLSRLGDDLASDLDAAATGADSEAMARIAAALEEAFRTLEGLGRALQNVSQDLPEDFVNQEALQTLDMNASRSLLEQIQDAIKRGDMEAALSLAQKFAEDVQRLQDALGKAHEGYATQAGSSALMDAIDKHARELEGIVVDQMGVLAETQRLEAKRIAADHAVQKDLLTELAGRQQAVIRRGTELAAHASLPPRPAQVLRAQLPIMRAIEAELSARQLEQSPAWLAAVMSALEPAEAEVAQATPAVSGILEGVSWVRREEADILRRLQNPPNAPADAADAPLFSALAERQGALRQRAAELRGALQVLSRQTAALGGRLDGSLQKAGDEMATAANALGTRDSRAAQTAEEAALSHLLDAQSGLQQAGASVGESGRPGGAGGAPTVLRRPGGATGAARTGRVVLPKEGDYRAPRAFREELMEALKESYPDVYEEIIHRYFKRLAE